MISIAKLIQRIAKSRIKGDSLKRALKLIKGYQNGSINTVRMKKELSLLLRGKTALYRGTGKIYKPNKEGVYTGKFPNKWDEEDWTPDRIYTTKKKKFAKRFPRTSRVRGVDTQKGYVQKYEVPNSYLKKHSTTRNTGLKSYISAEKQRELDNVVTPPRDFFWFRDDFPETFFNKGLPKKYLKEVVKKTSKRFKDESFSAGGEV